MIIVNKKLQAKYETSAIKFGMGNIGGKKANVTNLRRHRMNSRWGSKRNTRTTRDW